jgi:transcription elongation factor GreA
MSDALSTSPSPPYELDLPGGGLDGRRLLTPAELRRYQEQLAELHRIRDDDLPELLRAARELAATDAAEEIVQIHDDHAVVEARIGHLEGILSDAQVFDGSEHDADQVVPGRTVTLRYVRTGKEASLAVGDGVAAGTLRSVSVRSPVGQAILGRFVGDVVTVDLPTGRTEELLVVSVAGASPS